MKKIITGALAVLVLIMASGTAYAAGEETPIVRLHTNVYETYGPTNAISFTIAGTGGGYIDVDCGFGTVEYELADGAFDSETQTINATVVSCTVSPEGIVEIYGDAKAIEYLNVSGIYMDSIEMPALSNLQIFNAEHNELKALDLSAFTKLQAVYVSDNTFSAQSPLKIGAGKSDLTILEMSMVEHIDQSFNLSDYPSMVSFTAYSSPGLKKVDPTGCPGLMQLSIDVTPVETIDVSKNPELVILNVSDTKITSIDVSKNTKLQQLFCTHSASAYTDYKITSLDVSNNPNLFYLFAGYNALEALDVSKNPKLFDLSVPYNYLTSIDVSKNTNLYNLNLRQNYFSFATLPLNPGDWGEYYYEQRATPVAREYKVGDVLDFSTTMMRADSQTQAMLYKVNEEDFSLPILVDQSAYKFEDGRLTLLEAMADSVFVRFENTLFSEATLSTTNFVVKTEADFGKPTEAVSMLPAANTGEQITFTVGFDGATAESPKTFAVDFGDGVEKTFTATSSTLAGGCRVEGTRTGSGYLKIIVPEGVSLTALGVENATLYSIDLSKARMLRELTLIGTGLYDLDMTTLRCLTSIRLTGNNLSSFSVAGKNRNFYKTMLKELWAPANNIYTMNEDGLDGISVIDLSNNNLSEFTFSAATMTRSLNLAGNEISKADLTMCDALTEVNLSNNELSEITLPELSVLTSLDISDNRFTIATLPEPLRIKGNYSYVPQAVVEIPVKGPGADLNSQYRVIDGKTTAYTWFKADGSKLTEGTHYTIDEGRTRFLDSSLGKVYCAMTHPAFPAFDIAAGTALKTTELEVASMPNNVIAEFVTPVGGENVSLSLAAVKSGTTIFIDWKGDGIDLVTYELGDTYRLFDATTSANAHVKVYTYDDAAPLSVFSITGASMSSIDLSKLTEVSALSLSGTGLKSIELPGNGKIRELTIQGSEISALDLSAEPNISMLVLSGNKFEGSFDLARFKNLYLASLANNALTEVKLDNSSLDYLDLSGNSLSTIDLSGAPNLEQLSLNGNEFHAVDVSMLKKLKALVVDHNYFTFATLPPVKDSYVIYTYGNQATLPAVAVDNTVDLSSQAYVGNTPSTFRWFIDEPVYNREQEIWEGEELIENDEYTVNEGVTTFSTKLDRLVCLIQNSQFPKLALLTEMVNLSGVEEVTVCGDIRIFTRGSDIVVSTGAAADAVVVTASGSVIRSGVAAPGETVFSGLSAGIYIVRCGNTAAKVAIR